MDPRRARDPRLARVEPRLQRVPSESPAPPTPQQQPWAPIDPHVAPQQVQYQTSANASSNAPAPPSNEAPPASIYKPRPVFCVVCASNQVMINDTTTSIGSLTSFRIALWRDITSFSKQLSLHRQGRFSDQNLEKQVTESSRTARAPLFAFLVRR